MSDNQRLIRIAIRICGVLSLLILLQKGAFMLGLSSTYNPQTTHLLLSAFGVAIWLEAEWSWNRD